MIVRSLLNVSMMPDSSLLLGTGFRGSQEIINRINARWSNSGVIFGSDNDPFADKYKYFKKAFVNVARDTANLLGNAFNFMNNKEEIISIRSPDDLGVIPACMYIPILTYQPIRELFEQDMIYGWGIDKKLLPEEDEYGRMINNGYIGPDPITGIVPNEYEWHWKSDDPEYTIDELQDLADARAFIDRYIIAQMEEGGHLIDPTDFEDGGIIGGLK